MSGEDGIEYISDRGIFGYAADLRCQSRGGNTTINACLRDAAVMGEKPEVGELVIDVTDKFLFKVLSLALWK